VKRRNKSVASDDRLTSEEDMDGTRRRIRRFSQVHLHQDYLFTTESQYSFIRWKNNRLTEPFGDIFDVRDSSRNSDESRRGTESLHSRNDDFENSSSDVGSYRVNLVDTIENFRYQSMLRARGGRGKRDAPEESKLGKHRIMIMPVRIKPESQHTSRRAEYESEYSPSPGQGVPFFRSSNYNPRIRNLPPNRRTYLRVSRQFSHFPS